MISPTPSVEADDEGSFSMDDTSSREMTRNDDDDGGHLEPQFEGEDTRLTSPKELAGWYSYGFAAEVFAICAMGMARLCI